MSDPCFSIILPTRQRHQTLKYAIQTVLDQSYPDFELVVMDNKSTAETQQVVESFPDPRIRYFRSEERLTMSENWEQGLGFATGRYIFYLGDDDGMLPDALSVAHRFFSSSQAPILAWNRDDCIYWWKNSIVEHLRNQLAITIQVPRLIALNSLDSLRRVYQFEAGYQLLPMVYSAFVHRDLIFKIMLNQGQYFCHAVPDIFSGIVNAHHTETYHFTSRPLTMAGLSGQSTGHSFAFPHLCDQAMQTFLEEINQRGAQEEIHGDLPSEFNHAQVHIADTLLKTKALVFPDEDRIQFNMARFINQLSDHMGLNPATFDRETRVVRELARRNDIPEAEITLPQPRFKPPARFSGFSFDGDRAHTLTVDCEPLGIEDIYQASKLAYGILNRS